MLPEKAAIALSVFYMELDHFGWSLFSLTIARKHFRDKHLYDVENNFD